jgi:subtilisin family serine protease
VPQPPRIAVATEAQELPDEVLATFPTTTPPTADAALSQRLGLQLIESTTLTLVAQRIVRLRIPDGRSPAAVVAAILADAQAATAQPNYIYRQQQAGEASPVPQYALTKIAIDGAHKSATGRGVTVAVIDSGVDPRHPDLEGAALRVHDLFDGAGATDLAHGTAITGIIVARGQTRGVAPATGVLSVRAFQGNPSERSLRSSSFVILKAMDWSVSNGARVLNLSFAGARDPLLEKVVAAIAARRIIMVAAAGNGGRKAKPAYPAAYPDVIAVTATDARDRLYEHANVGGYVALSAPGVEVLVPNGSGGYDLVSGTSFAAAYISGIAALLLELEPSLEPENLLRLLQEAAIDLGAPGIDPEFGAGLANAAAALTSLRK